MEESGIPKPRYYKTYIPYPYFFCSQLKLLCRPTKYGLSSSYGLGVHFINKYASSRLSSEMCSILDHPLNPELRILWSTGWAGGNSNSYFSFIAFPGNLSTYHLLPKGLLCVRQVSSTSCASPYFMEYTLSSLSRFSPLFYYSNRNKTGTPVELKCFYWNIESLQKSPAIHRALLARKVLYYLWTDV